MSSQATFVVACLSGDALLDEIEDWVERWHESSSEGTLDKYLGFTPAEGALWGEKPASLRFIVAAHRYQTDVTDIIASADDFALAARATDPSSAKEVHEWLKLTDRI